MWVTLRKARKRLRYVGQTVDQHVKHVPGSPGSGPCRQARLLSQDFGLKKVRVSLQQHEPSKLIDVGVLLLGFKMSEPN